MTVTAMETPEGNTLVERIVEAAVLLVSEQSATEQEAQQFMTRCIATISCNSHFAEADSVPVQVDIMHSFREQLDSNLYHSG